jgi:Carbohydrate binding domain
MRQIFLLIALMFVTSIVGADDPAAPTETNLLKKTADVESWRFEQHEEGKGQIAVKDDGILFTVDSPGSENWHVQALQTDLDLKDGQSYTVKFKASSPNDHFFLLAATVDQDDYHEIGLHEEIYAENELKEYEFTFTASDTTEGKNRIGFVLSSEKGSVFVKDMVLTPTE